MEYAKEERREGWRWRGSLFCAGLLEKYSGHSANKHCGGKRKTQAKLLQTHTENKLTIKNNFKQDIQKQQESQYDHTESQAGVDVVDYLIGSGN